MLDGESDANRGLSRVSIDTDLFAEAARTRQAELAARAERRRQAFRSATLALREIAGSARLSKPDFATRVQTGVMKLGEFDPEALPRCHRR